VRDVVLFEYRWRRHVDVVIALQEKAQPERAVFPVSPHPENQGDDVRWGRMGMVPRAAWAVLKPSQAVVAIAIPPSIEERP
jgi:hypothetical protein